jgi:GH15 family glucan-1,4-alpha-glucosidase
MAKRIGDYALIGDGRTAALVGLDGSIDWFCPPRFDSPACFAALVGDLGNGRWRIAPADRQVRTHRRYRGNTLILETEFETDGGRCRLTDFMPVGSEAVTVVRMVTGLQGCVAMRMELIIRFEYGRLVPWVSRADHELVAMAGPDLVVLRTPVAHRGEGLTTVADFEIEAGQRQTFELAYGRAHRGMPKGIDVDKAMRGTERYWRQWADKCTYRGPYREAVVRSLLTIKALTYRPTGGIIAAPTTSLPEKEKGIRNWDYRYCWLRDATLALLSLMEAGYQSEAEDWQGWIERAVAGAPSQLQPIYRIDGGHRLDQWEVPWLRGFNEARPVRIGNDSFLQLQLDVYGEVMDAFHHARRSELVSNQRAWPFQKTLLDHLETQIDKPDKSIWEFRGPPQHFTYSKVMCWVAYDRAVSAVEDFGLDGPVDRWRRLRSRLHEEICTHGFDRKLGSFVQAYGSRDLDASCLLLPLVGFLPAKDPRVVGTVAAIAKRLMRDGLVHRYDTCEAEDALPEGEGAFLACSFWMADNLVLQGRIDEAQRLFERLLDLRNDVGLLAEEYDVPGGCLLGNFPQTLSHLTLIDTAYNLQAAEGPAHKRPKHRPEE